MVYCDDLHRYTAKRHAAHYDRQAIVRQTTELKKFCAVYGQRIERDSLDMVEKTSRMEENRQEQARILQDIDRMGGVGAAVRKKKS